VFVEGDKMVVAETLASLNAVKTAFDMAKALQNIHDATARDRAVIELALHVAFEVSIGGGYHPNVTPYCPGVSHWGVLSLLQQP
jgi:hypothetical protein